MCRPAGCDANGSTGVYLGNRWVLIAVALLVVFQLAFTYVPLMQSLFGTAPLGLATWGIIVLVASSVLWLVELEKLAVRRIRSGRS